MKIKSISDIPESLFNSLKIWTEASTLNFNILVGIGSIIMLAGIILGAYYYKKIGKEDEYSRGIYYKATSLMLATIFICDIFFPKTYMWNQFTLYKYAFATLVFALSLMYQYRRDFT